MAATRDVEPAPAHRSALVPRALTLLLLGGLGWLAAGGAITQEVLRHRADLGGHVRAVTSWTLRSVRAGALEATYADMERRMAQEGPAEDLGRLVQAAHAEELAKMAAVRRSGQIAFAILLLGGLLLSWNLARPRGRPARLLGVHVLGLTAVAAACLVFHLGLRHAYPPLPGDSKRLALPAILAMSVGALALLLLAGWVRRGRTDRGSAGSA